MRDRTGALSSSESTGRLTPVYGAARASMSPEVLRLRMAARAAQYNPDDSAALAGLAITAGIEPARLAAQFTGRAPLTRQTRTRIARTLNVTPTDSDPDADEALRRVRQGNPRPGFAPSPAALDALRRLEIEAAWDATSQGLAEYKAWVAA
jgi:hypothetical protein